MSTSFDQTPKWFDAEFYLAGKLAQLIADQPEANWTRANMLAAFEGSGFANPYDHYLAHGDAEGLNPNQFFNATEYLADKTAQLGSTYTPEMVAQAIHGNGWTIAQHYDMFGYAEGLNPSTKFNSQTYFEAKAEDMNRKDPEASWTPESVKAAIDGLGITALEHYFMFGKAEGMDQYDLSEGAYIPKPGKLDIKLTEGVDVVSPTAEDAAFKTTDRDDVISASVVATTKKSTLNEGDSIDGGAGHDTLKIDLQADFKGFSGDGGVKNVETIDLGNITTTRNFNAKGIEGADLYKMNLGGSTMNITNVDDATTAYSVQGGAGSALNVKILDTALASREDDVWVNVSNVGDAAPNGFTVNVSSAGAGNKVEELTIQSSGKSNFVNVTSAHDALTVMGSADIEITATGAIKAFDASLTSGKVTADLTATLGSLKTIEGGMGDDTLVIANSNAGTTAGPSIGQTISGFETMKFVDTGAGATTYAIDMTNITGLDTLMYTGSGTGIDKFVLANVAQTEFNFEYDSVLTGSTSEFSYDGAGALNVNLFGNGTGNDTINKVEANKVDVLNISNSGTAKNNTFTITDINADVATAINVNTGNGGVTFTGVSNDLAKLETVTVTGDGDFDLTTSANEKSLATIDADNFAGKLTLALGATTLSGDGSRGVEITVGSGGSDIKGTIGNDTITFGGGEDLFTFAATKALNGLDSFSYVGTNDQFNVNALGVTISTAVAITKGAATLSTSVAATTYVFEDGGTSGSGSNAKIDNYADLGQVADYVNGYITKSVASSANVFVINDESGLHSYIYRFLETGTGAAETAQSGELSLVGIVTDGVLSIGNITA